MGAYTVEALRETGMICVRGILDVFEGRVPACAVQSRGDYQPIGQRQTLTGRFRISGSIADLIT